LCSVFAAAAGQPSTAHGQGSSSDIPARGPNAGGFHQKLALDVGEQKVIDADDVRSFSEGVKGIIDIRLTKDNSRFVIIGLRAGATTVLFIMMDGSQVHYDVTVTDPNAGPQVSKDAVQSRDNIRLDLYFVELSSSYTHSIGLSWPTSIKADTTVKLPLNLDTGMFGGATATITSVVSPRLDLAQANGWAKLVRKAALITANGAQATFSGGGELNVVIPGGFGGSLKQITYGSQLGVKPRYDKESGRIELELTADISDLTSDTGTGAPGRTITTVQTVVNLELGQSVVLAGLSSASSAISRSGLPGLSQIPILGALFGTHAQATQDSQSVVFIVPTVIDVVSMQQRAFIEEALRSYDDYSGNLEYRHGLMPDRGKTR
jgi:pilus assembly protein CpaC